MSSKHHKHLEKPKNYNFTVKMLSGVTSNAFWVCCDCFVAHLFVGKENELALIGKKIVIKERVLIKVCYKRGSINC